MTLRVPVTLLSTEMVPQLFGVALVADLAVDAPLFSVEIQRADDDGLGAPDAGTYRIVSRLEPGRAVFVDSLPNDGALRHYRGRYVRSGWDPGAWTDWVAARPVAIYRVPDERPKVVYSAQVERLSDGTFTVYVDSHSGVKSVKVAWTANPLESTPAVGTGATFATDASGSVDVTDLIAQSGAQVPSEAEPPGGWAGPLKVRVTFYSGAGATGNILATVRTVDEYVQGTEESSNWVRGSIIPIKSGDGYKLQADLQVGTGTQKVRIRYNDPATGNLESVADPYEPTVPGSGIRSYTTDVMDDNTTPTAVVWTPTSAWPEMVVQITPIAYDASTGPTLTLDIGSAADIGVGTVRVVEGGSTKVVQTLSAANGVTIATGGVIKAVPNQLVVRSATDPGFSGADDDGKIWFQP